MKTRGRKNTPGEKLLMEQVGEEFRKKRDELGVKRAARALRVSVPSFYNYMAGTDLPRVEVLRDAQQKWGIKWKLIDPSKMLRLRKPPSAEQMLLPFLRSLREEDIRVVKVEAADQSSLEVMLKIRFPA